MKKAPMKNISSSTAAWNFMDAIYLMRAKCQRGNEVSTTQLLSMHAVVASYIAPSSISISRRSSRWCRPTNTNNDNKNKNWDERWCRWRNNSLVIVFLICCNRWEYVHNSKYSCKLRWAYPSLFCSASSSSYMLLHGKNILLSYERSLGRAYWRIIVPEE